ncbi:MAG: hypothetical protein RLZZ543_511, partial [Bacteroidota bacterium]
PTNGLVGYWPFNGNANDESGNGNDGTMTGTSFVQDRLGNQSSAMMFFGSTVPGTDNTVVANDQGLEILNFNNQFVQELSVSIWANTFVTTNGDVLSKRTNNDIDFVCTLSASNSTYFHLGNAGSVYDDLTTLSFDEWHLYTYVFNAGQMRTFVDGQLVSEAQGSIPLNNNTNYITIGKYVYFGGNTHYFYYNGILDDIGIWNRALTADEVLALYNGCNVTPQSISGNTTPSAFANSTYTCNNNAGSTYAWTVSNGVIASGQGSNTVDVLWGAEGAGSVAVTETTADGCVGDTVSYDVNVQCVVSGNAITGPVGPEAFSSSTYTCNGATNSTYNWTVTNGVIASGQGTNTVNILWSSTGLGNVSVVETTAEGCVGVMLSQDVVVIPVNVEELSNALILYPNPVRTELNLQTTSDLIGTDLFIFDALGKQILMQQILSANTTINTSAFAAGNYVVKVGGVVKRFEVVR